MKYVLLVVFLITFACNQNENHRNTFVENSVNNEKEIKKLSASETQKKITKLPISEKKEIAKLPATKNKKTSACCPLCLQIYINSYDIEDPIEVGEFSTYVVEISNKGITPVTNLVLKDILPKQMKFISAKVTMGKYKISKEKNVIVFSTLPILKPGEKVTYTIVVKAITFGLAKNQAIIIHDQFKREIIEEESTLVGYSIFN